MTTQPENDVFASELDRVKRQRKKLFRRLLSAVNGTGYHADCCAAAIAGKDEHIAKLKELMRGENEEPK